MAGNFIELTQSVTREERRLWRALPTKCGSFRLNPVLWGTYNISAFHSAMQNVLNSAFPKTRSCLQNGSLSLIEYEHWKTLNSLTITSTWYFEIWTVGKSDIIARVACFYFLFYFSTHSFSLYRVIHKTLGDFRTRLRNNQGRHGRKEHINR